MRTEFFLERIDERQRGAPRRRSRDEVGEPFEMDWRLTAWASASAMAILVSRHDHCLLDLLWRWRRGELDAEIVAGGLEPSGPRARDVRGSGVPYHHVPVEKGDKAEAEARDARAARRPRRAARAGPLHADPQRRLPRADRRPGRSTSTTPSCRRSPAPIRTGRALERGVKLIGATAHYVTEELDDGPDHRAGRRPRRSPPQRGGAGADRPRHRATVLARAVKLHLEDRVIEHDHKTFVFL